MYPHAGLSFTAFLSTVAKKGWIGVSAGTSTSTRISTITTAGLAFCHTSKGIRLWTRVGLDGLWVNVTRGRSLRAQSPRAFDT